MILYEWYSETIPSKVAEEYGMCISTVHRHYKRYRSLASVFTLMDTRISLGGIGKTVEIDETLIAKRKYNEEESLVAKSGFSEELQEEIQKDASSKF